METSSLAFSFSPSLVTLGSSAAAVVIIIAKTAGSDKVRTQRGNLLYAPWLLLPGLLLISTRTGRRKSYLAISLLALFSLALLLTSCSSATGTAATSAGGGGGGGGQQQRQGTQPGTYTITVTGTSGTLTHQATAVALIVNQ